MTSLILLPVLAAFLMFRLLAQERLEWRIRFISVFVLCGLFVAFSTEVLSLFRALNIRWVAGSWAVLVLALLALLRYSASKKSRQAPLADSDNDVLSKPFQLAVWGVAIVISLTGLVAFVAPPNTWDSMAYHMARVAHWIQNGTVRHYPTCFLPQLYHPPWAEFAILQLQILTGSDRFANGVQWLSLIGSVLGVSLIAKLLGGDSRAQVFAAVFAATLPMGILQGSSTQNDFVVTFFLVSFVAYSLKLVGNRTWSVEPGAGSKVLLALGMGSSLGLALLTKATAYIYAAPFVVWFALVIWKRDRWKAVPLGLMIAAIVLVLNAGHFARNMQLFGSPLANGGESYVNQVYTPSMFVSNVVRNLSLHAGTPLAAVNTAMSQAVIRLHDALGISADDPRTSAWMAGPFKLNRMDTEEDVAGNPLHAVLILVSITAFVFRKSLRQQAHLAAYLASVSATFLVFNVLLKWQPFHSRLHLPLFVLFAPFVSIVILQWRGARLATYVMAVLLVASLPWVLVNQTRSLIPAFRHGRSILVQNRLDGYFQRDSVSLREPYNAAATFIGEQKLRYIGLILPYDPNEYQLWVLVKRAVPDARLEHIEVKNASSAASDGANTFTPTAIIRVRSSAFPLPDGNEPLTELHVSGGAYARRWSMEPLEVFVREGVNN